MSVVAVVKKMAFERSARQFMHPGAVLHERDESGQEVVARDGGLAADDQELGAGAGEGHVDTAPVLEQIADVARFVAPHQAQDDDLLVAALELVRRVHLDRGKMAQVVLQQRELGPVERDDADVAGADAGGEQGRDDLLADRGFAGVDEARTALDFARGGEESVGVDEAGFGGGINEGAKPAACAAWVQAYGLGKR